MQSFKPFHTLYDVIYLDKTLYLIYIYRLSYLDKLIPVSYNEAQGILENDNFKETSPNFDFI